MIVTAKVLKHTPHPSETDVLEALRYNLCRCGAHIEILRAVMRPRVISPRPEIDSRAGC
jgi:nicotinate dehydrogenase subunit A